MSDERDTPSPDDPAYALMPPELRPYLGKSGWKLTKVPKPGEDPALDEAVAAFKALDTEKFDTPPPVQDLSVGMGNASEYVAPASLPEVLVGATAADAGRVELAMKDVPRALPAYSPTRETVETRVVRLAKQAEAKTVGGHTQKLAVIKVTSPAAAPVEVPSERALAQDDEPTRPAGRARTVGAVLGGAVLLVATAIGIRAATTATPPSAPVATSTQAAVASTAVPSEAPAAAPPSVEPPIAMPSPSASAAAEPSATSSDARRPSAPNQRRASDEPYDAAPAPRPPVTSQPSATAAPAPPPTPTVVPTGAPTVAPKAPASASGSEKPIYD